VNKVALAHWAGGGELLRQKKKFTLNAVTSLVRILFTLNIFKNFNALRLSQKYFRKIDLLA
jgi:hypothetical protein